MKNTKGLTLILCVLLVAGFVFTGCDLGVIEDDEENSGTGKTGETQTPGVPIGLSAKDTAGIHAGGLIGVTLTWNEVTGLGGGGYYRIYRSTTGAAYTQCGESRLTTWRDTANLFVNSSVYYKVSAVNTSGTEGVQSMQVKYTFPEITEIKSGIYMTGTASTTKPQYYYFTPNNGDAYSIFWNETGGSNIQVYAYYQHDNSELSGSNNDTPPKDEGSGIQVPTNNGGKKVIICVSATTGGTYRIGVYKK